MENRAPMLLTPNNRTLQKPSRPNSINVTPVQPFVTVLESQSIQRILPNESISASVSSGSSNVSSEQTPSSPYVPCPNMCGSTFVSQKNLNKHISSGRCKSTRKSFSPIDPILNATLIENARLKEQLTQLESQNRQILQVRLNMENSGNKRIENIKSYDQLEPRSKRKRRKLLMDDVMDHAGSAKVTMFDASQCYTDSISDELLWDSLRANKGSTEFLKKVLPKDPKCVEILNVTLNQKRESAAYSESNKLRTASVLFWGMQKMSKREFRHMKKGIEAMVGEQAVVPLVKYDVEMKFLRKEISYIQKDLLSIRENLGIIANNRQIGGGLFQSLEPLAIRIATKLIRAANRPNPIIVFNWCRNEFEFHLGVGMDEFPLYGESVTTFLLKFLDIGSQAHSPEQMGLLLATNFKEGSEACFAYWRRLAEEMKALTSKEDGFVVEIGGKQHRIWFKFLGVGGDQKAIMEGAGGVSCAFRRPSPYANLDKQQTNDNRMKVNGKIGEDWEVFSLEQRLAHAAELAKKIQKFKVSNKREPANAKINDFIYEIGGQQRIPPPMGWMIEHLYVCALHVGLLAARDWLNDFLLSFVDELTEFMSEQKGVKCPKSPLPTISRNDTKFETLAKLHDDQLRMGQLGFPLVLVTDCFSDEMDMRQISSKTKKMWVEGQKSVGFRFTGKDLKNLCHYGTSLTGTLLYEGVLVKLLCPVSAGRKMTMLRQRLVFFHFMLIILRKILALAHSTQLTEEEILSLDTLCRWYHCLKVAMHKSSRSQHNIFHQNDWTIGYIIPFHARNIWEKYKGKGLGLMSMQGHELAHQMTKSFLAKTQPSAKWRGLFENWEIATIYLPDQTGEVGINYNKGGHSRLKYSPASASEIPLNEIKCENQKCRLCSSVYSSDLREACKTAWTRHRQYRWSALKAIKRLQDNPNDLEALKMMHMAEEQDQSRQWHWNAYGNQPKGWANIKREIWNRLHLMSNRIEKVLFHWTKCRPVNEDPTSVLLRTSSETSGFWFYGIVLQSVTCSGCFFKERVTHELSQLRHQLQNEPEYANFVVA